MALTNRDFVVQDLLDFFRSRCAKPEYIKDESTDARHYCGYDQNLAGWRLLADSISHLPHILAFGYWLAPTDMDGAGTIGKIADKLMEGRKRTAPIRPADRTGRAQFLALSERS